LGKIQKTKTKISQVGRLLVTKLRADLAVSESKPKNIQTFLIQRVLQLSNEKQQAQQELTAAQTQYLNQGNQLLELQTKLREQEEEIKQLKTANTTLNKLAEKELKSKNRENNRLFYEKEDLEAILEKVAEGYSKKRLQTKKLTKIQKVGVLLMEKLRGDLTDLKSEFSVAQAEIKALKQDNQNLTADKKLLKKELKAEIKELKKSQKEQEQELTNSQKKITNQARELTTLKEELNELQTEKAHQAETIHQFQTEKAN